ncbi:AAA family ATPase [Clostridium sp. KNHs205]|uniref:AAA family ATPase n=2 Tax=Clostridium sp. KNHs205 TaxID=1449050 RepID=UPI00051AF781|nr:AAA family ATPase [Clostridium sp. KNHs205]
MGLPVLIIGKSGSGKSASLRNFNEGLALINVLGKPLPFKSKIPKVVTDDYQQIMKQLFNKAFKSFVIDDAGYLITNHFMSKHSSTGGGNAVFSLYNDLGDYFWNLIQFVIRKLPADRIVYFIMHEDINDFGDIRPKTIGKLLDEKVCVEGMFTIVLRCVSENNVHKFITQSDAGAVSKSPMGMFETLEIDNDLKFVDDSIREYYELDKEDTNNAETK